MKNVGIIATVVAALLGLTQLYEWVFRAGPEISLTVSEYPFVYPETFREFFYTVASEATLSEAVLAQLSESSDESDDNSPEVELSSEMRLALSQVGQLMPNGLPGLPFGYRSEFQRYIRVQVSNDGNARATNLVLRLIPLSQVRINPVTGDSYRLDGSFDRIPLGELLPGESIIVAAWDSDSPDSFSSNVEEITVFHDAGYTEADVYEMVPSLWVGISKHWPAFAWLIGGTLLYVFVVVLSARPKKKQQNSDESPNHKTQDSVSLESAGEP